MKNISVLGSTGSIGIQTLEICRQSIDLNITGLTCNSNTALLKKQINASSGVSTKGSPASLNEVFKITGTFVIL